MEESDFMKGIRSGERKAADVVRSLFGQMTPEEQHAFLAWARWRLAREAFEQTGFRNRQELVSELQPAPLSEPAPAAA